ncbi:PucR family transcriptional regulator [Amycolatopsis sp.]|uniref:PucR family transcriptional regulator n=1 Tax=Amycolatopsis sp. TaxID=37632 RepID=UPI002DFCCF3F|nr:helix-turn-helix domain-containing protein [Amycolatopsis sp.]
MLDEAVVSERIKSVAAGLAGKAGELTGDLVKLYEKELPQLVHDDERMVSLLSASVYQNLETGLQIFQHGIDPTRVEAPAAAMEYARRLAQRGTPVIDLIRAYYLGQTAILDYAIAETTGKIDDPILFGAMMRHLLTGTFAFIDRVSQQVVSAYQEERDRWLFNRSAVRTARVRALLDSDGSLLDIDGVDVEATEAALGYRMRGVHLGMIVWHTSDAYAGDALGALEALAVELGKRLEGDGRPLFVPRDESSAWVWLPLASAAFPDSELLDQALASSEPGVRLSLGEPGLGIQGFRHTHQQALRVHALALAAGEHCDRALTFREVGTMALMTSDLGAARLWVADTLGAMSADDSNCERLRDTLRVFLATGSSYTAAAAALTMHKNSVQYRVRKAQELLVRPITENRLDVELALNLCHRLGAAVLS